jgi:hypothetical protein
MQVVAEVEDGVLVEHLLLTMVDQEDLVEEVEEQELHLSEEQQ